MPWAPVGNDGRVSAERIADEPAHGSGYGWRRDALDAEMATGTREADDQAARASLVVRAARISAGTIVTLLGLSLLVLPGPGLVVVAAGLSILAIDVPFARRLLQRVRDRLPQDADGGTPTWLLVTMGLGLAAGLGASAAFMLL